MVERYTHLPRDQHAFSAMLITLTIDCAIPRSFPPSKYLSHLVPPRQQGRSIHRAWLCIPALPRICRRRLGNGAKPEKRVVRVRVVLRGGVSRCRGDQGRDIPVPWRSRACPRSRTHQLRCPERGSGWGSKGRQCTYNVRQACILCDCCHGECAEELAEGKRREAVT